MIDPAMSQDEQRRRQQEAEQHLTKTIGVQNEAGEQLHGRARTEQARNLRDEMKAAAADNRAGVNEEQKAKNVEDRAAKRSGATVRVSINAPHKATVRGNQIALTIRASDGKAGSSDEGRRVAELFVNGQLATARIPMSEPVVIT